jgi:hypothetical protein
MGKNIKPAWDTDDGDAFELKMEEWEERDWATWLENNLTFPFAAVREDDNGEAFAAGLAKVGPLSLGHKMDVLALEPGEDEVVGFLVSVREGKHEDDLPLADLEVTPKSDKNFWPVREYAVWFANRI